MHGYGAGPRHAHSVAVCAVYEIEPRRLALDVTMDVQ
jgi:hypothetical protein